MLFSSGLTLFGQNPGNPCDDDNPNTLDTVDARGHCYHIPIVCCDDGDPNTYDYVDAKGRCHHVVKICCDDGNDCTLDRYDPVKKACVHEPIPNCPTCKEDKDKDGTPDCDDRCPNDPNKTEPGACGCGVEDTDSDKDGIADCNDPCPNDKENKCKDLCPDDPNKTEPGACGCGVKDTDSDKDGVPDCEDNCPNDPKKTEPGACGCGVADLDSDKDGTPNCKDDCPNDPGKTKPGACGCGFAETDTDRDGTPDCNDECPNDPGKTKPGNCGCGASEDSCDDDECEGLVSNGCAAAIQVDFISCTKVKICSSKDLSNVVLDIAPYGPSKSDLKFDGLSGHSGAFSSGGAAILGVWVKSGCNFETNPNLQCPGCGTYVDSPLNCAGSNIAPEEAQLKPSSSGQAALKDQGQPNSPGGLSGAKTFKIFPNPGKSDFRIDLGAYAGKTATVLVFDLSGKLIKKQDVELFSGGLIDLAMPNQVAGMYQVKILFKDAEPLLGSFIIQE